MPSDEKIEGYKDFGRILADHRNLTQPIYRKPLYKNPKAFAGLFLILAIFMLVFWTIDKDAKEAKDNKGKAGHGVENTHNVTPPKFPEPLTAQLALPAKAMLEDFDKPQRLSLENGIELNFPASSFEDSNGQPIHGAVDVKVKVAQNPAEWIAMGIPLATQNEVLMSQYILDISASQEGKPVQLVEGKEIEINIPTKQANTPSVFLLDIPQQEWKMVDGASVEKVTIDPKKLNIGDGFGVVEFDAEGNPIPKKPASDTAVAAIHLFQIRIPALGTFALAEASPQNQMVTQANTSFVDTKGKKMELRTVYGLPQAKNTLQIFHPKTTAHDFDLAFMPGTASEFVAFLPDGRLANSSAIKFNEEKTEHQTIEMQISDAPVKNLKDLTQRLANF